MTILASLPCKIRQGKQPLSNSLRANHPIQRRPGRGRAHLDFALGSNLGDKPFEMHTASSLDFADMRQELFFVKRLRVYHYSVLGPPMINR